MRLADVVPSGWLKTGGFDLVCCAHILSCPRALEKYSPPQLQRRSDDYCTWQGRPISASENLRTREQANVAPKEMRALARRHPQPGVLPACDYRLLKICKESSLFRTPLGRYYPRGRRRGEIQGAEVNQ